MTYVMSDLHGCQKEFYAMLEKIHFGQDDHLYIIGDIIDRGPHSIELLLEIMEMPNVTVLMGNHEYFFYSALFWGEDAWQMKRDWFRECNGGHPTWEYYRECSQKKKSDIKAFIRDLPITKEIQVGERCFYLVHGYPADNLDGQIWGRPNPTTNNPIPGKTVIVGHTPTPNLEEEQFWTQDAQIVHLPGLIDIDCGSVCWEYGKLACLRLEDMKEFYVDAGTKVKF